jgi:hypothetical protein
MMSNNETDEEIARRILVARFGTPATIGAHDDAAAKRILAARSSEKSSALDEDAAAKRILAARYGGAESEPVQTPAVGHFVPAAQSSASARRAPPHSGAPVKPAVTKQRTKSEVFALRVEGVQGAESLARLTRRIGRLPAQIFVGKRGGIIQVLTVSAEHVNEALAACGEIAPGLLLEQQQHIIPLVALAKPATRWLLAALKAKAP